MEIQDAARFHRIGPNINVYHIVDEAVSACTLVPHATDTKSPIPTLQALIQSLGKTVVWGPRDGDDFLLF